MNTKKLVIITGSMSDGGAERVLSLLSNNLVQDYEITIVSIYNSEVSYKIADNINRINISMKSRYFRQFKIILKLRKTIIDLRPFKIISFLSNVNIYTLIATYHLEIPIIISERNDPNKEPSKFYLRLLRKVTYKWAETLVLQTNQSLNFFQNYPINKVIIRNPIDPYIRFTCEKDRSDTIYTVARLTKQKNLFLLIDAFIEISKKHTSYMLDIYGEGELRNPISDYIKANNFCEKIQLKGFQENIYDRIVCNKLFVLSSDYEGLPNSLIEAMALGIPSISTDCPIGGPGELIDNFENGILVQVNDKEGLINAIDILLTDNELSEKLSRNSKKIHKILDLDVIINEWKKIIEDKYA